MNQIGFGRPGAGHTVQQIASRRSALGGALGLAVACFAPGALAQDATAYPARPIVLVVPQTAGGTNDIVGRVVGQKLGEILGQPVAVENRPGAGGNIGTQHVARGPKDGYTLLMTISSSQAINPALYKDPGFDPVKDFAPIALIGSVPNVLLANPAFPARSTAELIAMAKGKPGEIQYASAGNGTLNHLLGEMLGSLTKTKLQHVPYKGVAPAMNDVLGGQVPLVFASLPSALAHIKAGKLRALGVSSPERAPALPDVPAIGETVPGFSGTLWVGLFAPAGLPDAVVQKLQAGMVKVLASQDLRAKLEQQGVQLAASPEKPVIGAEFGDVLQRDLGQWARIVKMSGARVD